MERQEPLHDSSKLATAYALVSAGRSCHCNTVRECQVALEPPPEDTKVRSSKYLNNLIEQDHRHIKSRTNVMLGFKRFRSAATTISCVELMHRIRKGQFDLGLEDIAVPSVWNVVLINR
jgi:transposase-like protein